MTRLLNILLILLLTGCATQAIGATTSLTPKVSKKSAPVNAKQSFQLMSSKRVPGPHYNITTLSVVWDFVNDGHTSFWVYSSTNISNPLNGWLLKAIADTNGLPVKLAVNGHEYYAARPSNTLFHQLYSQYIPTKPMRPKLYQP